ncbi:zeta toxin family protein [Tissierella sp.]|uniref:zeta toxin family protein n=1 Tax=Tissierella sp. TaxID=41274 RepID=UPI0030D9BF9A
MNYTVIAGVNGAGKSIFYNSGELDRSKLGVRVNVDELIAERYNNNWKDFKTQIRAGKEIVREINRCIENKLSFNQETTLAGKTILNTIEKAKKLEYIINLHYIGINSPELAISRVRERVLKGGHGIPDETIYSRYFNSLENLQEILPICDNVYIYDNSVNKKNILIVENKIIKFKNVIPEYIESYIEPYIKELEYEMEMEDEEELEL